MVFLLTFRCYGSHLRGEADSVDRTREPSGRGGPIAASEGLREYSADRLRQAPFLLDRARADVVLASIQETCRFRGWALLAAHVRTNHVHVVVDGIPSTSVAFRDLKGYATRALAAADGDSNRLRWARHGSTQLLPSEEAVAAGVRYVVAGQGEPMAVYVAERLTW